MFEKGRDLLNNKRQFLNRHAPTYITFDQARFVCPVFAGQPLGRPELPIVEFYDPRPASTPSSHSPQAEGNTVGPVT